MSDRRLQTESAKQSLRLDPAPGIVPGVFLGMVPAEDLMRIWDAIVPSYRSSLSYVARSVRIEPEFE